MYLLLFSVVSLVSLNIKFSFLIESLYVLLSFLNDLVSHFFFQLLLLLKLNGILTVPAKKKKKGLLVRDSGEYKSDSLYLYP